MNEPLDELYLTWLYRKVVVGRSKNPNQGYWALLRLLYTKEFVWIIPNDDNRVEDGLELRYEFIDEEHIEVDEPDWMELPCSMFEMMIGLARRLSFEADGEPRVWFWTLMKNIQLDSYTDDRQVPVDDVNDVLDQVIWRTYNHNGVGGLFPLRRSKQDQRDVEIWYQLNSYLLAHD